MDKYYFGIDISSIQGVVDFKKEKENGVDFVIVKCYEGNKGTDKNYKMYVKQAQDAGLAVGTYHFVYPLPQDGKNINRSPKEQAELHFKECLTHMVACDIEWPYNQDWLKWNCNANQINDWVMNYLIEYEKLSGVKPYVYTYPSFADGVKFSKEITNYPLWIASYKNSPYVPKPWTDWEIWQNSGGEIRKLLNGVKVDTNYCKDLSIFYKNKEDIEEIKNNEMFPIFVENLPEKKNDSSEEVIETNSKKSFLQVIIEFILSLLGR